MAKNQNVSTKDFVHLHNHTQYSLLDGLSKVPDLTKKIKQLGMNAVAVTDHGTLSGSIEFYKSAMAMGIKPIIGMETYVAARSISDRDPVKDKNSYHLILLAMNDTGYQNLMRLSSIANLEGLYYRPRIDHHLLKRYNEGLIVLSGCIGGEVGDALRQNQYETAKKTAQWYRKVFGDRYYLEIQDHGHPLHKNAWDEQVTVNKEIMRLSKDLKIPSVLTCDAHYLNHQDQEAHEILLCVQTGAFLSDENRLSLKNFELHVTDPKEIINRWAKEYPEVITNTSEIARRCQVKLELGKYLIPKFPVPKGQNEKSYLDKLTYHGLVKRYRPNEPTINNESSIAKLKKLLNEEVLKRAEYELSIIDRMGFNGYFLIVQDFINWGKDNGIVFGPGRGSGASSIVAYGLRITELDPLEYDLLFERFLNPDRISMPDFDIDIQDNRRDEVIAYCVEKYGSDRVANIVTFGRMAARNAVRDVARVLQVPYAEADRLAKMIPQPIQGRHIPLVKSLKENNELQNEYRASEQSRRVFDLAIQLEGTIRSHGVHAAGVVIAPDEIVKFVPLEMAQKGVVTTQYSMGPIEELGLLKMDFLGLSNLTIIKNALRIIKKLHHEDVDISVVPLNDDKTYDLLARGDTTGVFQLESAGMKRYLKQLKPNLFADIIAMVALYRPGPMAEFPRFIEGKNNPSSITYPHPTLKPILSDTYGVIVFQEQIIALLQLLAGYSPGEADLVRKAIGKKNRETMEAERPRFIDGCLKRGLTKSGADKLWALIQPFADYSFNKAHAACYALIAYQTAYLKAHFPTEFMAALMTSDFDNTDRLAIEINECKNMNIKVLPPDVNESFVEFSAILGKAKIRFGMAAIKNVGTAAVEEILRARKEHTFNDLSDFFERVNLRIVNRKALESLIKAGALDIFEKRDTLLNNLDILLAYASRKQKQQDVGQTDLFGNQALASNQNGLKLVKSDVKVTENDQLKWERELLGIYLSKHPLDAYEAWLTENTMPIMKLTTTMDNKTVKIGGVVNDVREISTKNGQKMAFIKLADKEGELELILFPGKYNDYKDVLLRDKVVFVNGKLSFTDNYGNSVAEPKILVDKASSISEDEARSYTKSGKKVAFPKATIKTTKNENSIISDTEGRRVYVRVPDSQNRKMLLDLRTVISENSGDVEVILVLGESTNKQAIKLPMKIRYNQTAIQRLEQVVGKVNIKLG